MPTTEDFAAVASGQVSPRPLMPRSDGVMPPGSGVFSSAAIIVAVSATGTDRTTFNELGRGVPTQPNRVASLLSPASTADSREVAMYGSTSVGMVLTYLDSRAITLRTQTDRRILIEEATMQK